MMIVKDHQIAYRNVASKYYRFLPEEIDLAIQDFSEILSDYGFHASGAMFFSILSDPTAEIMTAEVFIPLEESHFTIPKEEEIKFRSYFSISRMLMTRVVEDVENVSQVKYWALFDYIKKHELTQKTPIFVEVKTTNQGVSYSEMSIGIL